MGVKKEMDCYSGVEQIYFPYWRVLVVCKGGEGKASGKQLEDNFGKRRGD